MSALHFFPSHNELRSNTRLHISSAPLTLTHTHTRRARRCTCRYQLFLFYSFFFFSISSTVSVDFFVRGFLLCLVVPRNVILICIRNYALHLSFPCTKKIEREKERKRVCAQQKCLALHCIYCNSGYLKRIIEEIQR